MTSMPNKSISCFKVKEQCDFRTPLEDKIRVMVRSSALKSPISTRLIPSVQMTSSKVLGEITKVLQSNEEIPLDKSFTIDIIGVKAPTGSGGTLDRPPTCFQCNRKWPHYFFVARNGRLYRLIKNNSRGESKSDES